MYPEFNKFSILEQSNSIATDSVHMPKPSIQWVYKNDIQYVYAFLYCDCIYESAWATMSLHRSLKGAYEAMKKHRIANFNEWRNLPNKHRKDDFKDTFAKDWRINKKEILP